MGVKGRRRQGPARGRGVWVGGAGQRRERRARGGSGAPERKKGSGGRPGGDLDQDGRTRRAAGASS